MQNNKFFLAAVLVLAVGVVSILLVGGRQFRGALVFAGPGDLAEAGRVFDPNAVEEIFGDIIGKVNSPKEGTFIEKFFGDPPKGVDWFIDEAGNSYYTRPSLVYEFPDSGFNIHIITEDFSFFGNRPALNVVLKDPSRIISKFGSDFPSNLRKAQEIFGDKFSLTNMKGSFQVSVTEFSTPIKDRMFEIIDKAKQEGRSLTRLEINELADLTVRRETGRLLKNSTSPSLLLEDKELIRLSQKYPQAFMGDENQLKKLIGEISTGRFEEQFGVDLPEEAINNAVESIFASKPEACVPLSFKDLEEDISNLERNLKEIPETNQEAINSLKEKIRETNSKINSYIEDLNQVNEEVKRLKLDIAGEKNSKIKAQKEFLLEDKLKDQEKINKKLGSRVGFGEDLKRQLEEANLKPNDKPFRRSALEKQLAKRKSQLSELSRKAGLEITEECAAKNQSRSVAKKAATEAAEEVTEGLGKKIGMTCLKNAGKILGLIAGVITGADYLRESLEERVKFTVAAFEESCKKQKSGRPTSFIDQVLSVEAALLPFFETHTELGKRVQESTDFGFGEKMDQKELEQRLFRLAAECPDLYKELENLKTFQNDTELLYSDLKRPTKKQLDLFRKNQTERQRQEDLRKLRTIPGF